MVLKIYNTMTRKKEEFKPLTNNRVYLFVCGPTVYDYSHLGHARTYVSYDVIARWLRHRGYSLLFLMNITDIDDKIIKRAEEKKVDPIKLAREYEKYFYEDMNALGIDTVNIYARATEHIPEIISQIRRLVDKGYAYETDTGIYFDIGKFPGYGKLSHQKPEELRKHRVEPDPTKKNPQDFSLWKKHKPGEPSWDSPWGRGRPGWHVEDTAIAERYLGQQYDIHGGAVDLIFPHHEAEIAQMESLSGKKPMVKYWIHTGFLLVRGEKMAKSLGNFVTIREALKKWPPETLRFFLVSTHYRSPVDYSEEKIEQAQKSLETLYNALNTFEGLKEAERDNLLKKEKEMLEEAVKAEKKFSEAMDDDFNTPLALSALFELARKMNLFSSKAEEVNPVVKRRVTEVMRRLGSVLGILKRKPLEIEKELTDQLIELILELRDRARKIKDWGTADWIRDKLGEIGIELEDTEKETKWRFKRI